MTQPDSQDTFGRYSETAVLALYYSRAALTEHGGKAIELAHLLFGLLKAADTDMSRVLSQGVALQPLAECLISRVSSPDLPDESVEVPFAAETKSVLHGATVIANEYAHDVIRPEHLLLSLLRHNTGPAVECLRRAGVDTGRAGAELADVLKGRAHYAV